ncbi:hypothetical protein [Xanthobacter sp. ZOL 2024]
MSADVIDMESVADEIMQDRYSRFLALDAVFQRTKRLQDGIAAGRAKNEFYDLFLSSEARQSNVIFRDFGER